MKRRSNVNFKKLIQDLTDMYTAPVHEVIVSELIANSLDAGADEIRTSFNPSNNCLTVEDNGSGMTRKQFEEYHDFAAELKTRGNSIGFAGLGAKISFNIAEKIITETWSKSFKGRSKWYFLSKDELVWEEEEPKEIDHYGTLVKIYFPDSFDKMLFSQLNLERIITLNYLPLLDERLLSFYAALNKYPENLRFYVNGKKLGPIVIEDDFSLSNFSLREIYLRGRPIGYALFGISNDEYPLGENNVGVGICVLGKVVKFELFNQSLGENSTIIFGIAEVPELINFLTTNKSDFIRKIGKQAKKFKAYYDEIAREFRNWCDENNLRLHQPERTNEAINIERQLRSLINSLPEIAELFSADKKNVLVGNKGDISAEEVKGSEPTFPGITGDANSQYPLPILDDGDNEGSHLEEKKDSDRKAQSITRTRRRSVHVSFIEDPKNLLLSWMEDNAIIINTGHPSFQKIQGNTKAKNLYYAFALALAIEREARAREMINEDYEGFIGKILFKWGEIS